MSKINFKDIKKLVGKDDPIVFEVGAHYGEDSLNFIKTFQLIDLHCFEPDPRNIDVLIKTLGNINYNLFKGAVSQQYENSADFYLGYEKNVPKCMLKKYSWIDESVYIDKKLNASGASSLKKGHPLLEGNPVVKVDTIRLDKYCSDNRINRIDFLWIDVQGAERGVLQSLGAYFPAVRYIWVEYGEMDYDGAMGRDETIKAVIFNGFEVLDRYSSKGKTGNLMFRNNSEKCRNKTH